MPAAASPSSSKVRSKRRTLGPYDLLRKLGQGAMGAVYLARHQQTDQRVALKVLPPDLAQDHEFLERFKREMRATLKLRHPNVVGAFDFGEDGGFYYFAMEFVNGEDLEEGFSRQPNKRYSPAEVLSVAKDIALALEAASSVGIVHRDIKPANILKDENGVYKLTDLGLAARLVDDERVTQTGLAVGTPYYISPEQAQGYENVDVRADIYSLGATLYHLATGCLPFADDNAIVVMTRHVQEELKPPNEIVPDLPKGLCRLIQKMMAKRPGDRHRNAQELLADISLIAKGEVPLLKRARANRKITQFTPIAPSAPRPKPVSKPSPGEDKAEKPRRKSTGPAKPVATFARRLKPALFWGGLVLAAVIAGIAVRVILG
ncbi:MAG: serine/threonine protein kinase [Planctomycetota bacterium]|nr:serine/threonine protein kinase [Planctomycetota bacterium]